MIIIHDSRLPRAYIEAADKLLGRGIRWYPLDMSGDSAAYSAILSHPDIYFFVVDEGTVIYAPNVPGALIKVLRENGVTAIRGSSLPGEKYPATAAYNAVRVGGIMLHDLRYTDPVIVREMASRGVKRVHVGQGYTRCSVISVGKSAIVTSDKGISERARAEGVNAVTVVTGHVELPGETYGFLGGSSGNTPGGGVILLGDITHHPEAQIIKDIFTSQNTRLIALEGLPLFDAGSLLIF